LSKANREEEEKEEEEEEEEERERERHTGCSERGNGLAVRGTGGLRCPPYARCTSS
jgi:hypothetical protein